MVTEREFEFIAENVMVIYDRTFPLYVVFGEKNFLIDSGPAARASEFVERLNHTLTSIGDQFHTGIDTLILTHSHWDHTGGSSYLQAQYGFTVLASRRTVDLLEKTKVIETIDGMNRGFWELNPGLPEIHFTGLKNLQVAGPADIIAIDNQHYFQVIATPGHTKCSLSLLMHPGSILFPGDAAGLMEPDCTIRPLFFSDYAEYENSLEKLIGLEANAIAFPHNKRIMGKEHVKDYLDDSLYRTRQVKTAIEKLLTEKTDIQEVARRIYDQEFPNISFMGPREILVLNLESMVRSVIQAGG